MDKFPTIVRTYHKVWVEMEVAHDLWDHEWDGVEYESLDEAKAVMNKAQTNLRVYNAWIQSYAVDSEGKTWDFDAEWQEAIKNQYIDENGHSEYGLYGEEN